MIRARAALAAVMVCASAAGPPVGGAAATAPQRSFAQLADDAALQLTRRWYAGGGQWHVCLDAGCDAATNGDWAADSLTGALYERWTLTHDAALTPIFRALEHTAPRYGECRAPRCRSWSDVPVWDAVAAIRLYDATHDASALRTAAAAYRNVAASDAYAHGACPLVDYQRPNAEGGGLKTLETGANRVLAAVLLAQRLRDRRLLDAARRRYAAIRAVFFDRPTALYTVYAFDDGTICRPLPRRFFASVQGLMIEAGYELSRATRVDAYARDAHRTARAVRALDDGRGIFTDLQAENDIVEPLVFAMLTLARSGDADARAWILRNAGAAAHARRADGVYGRFFDGPPPEGTITAWQANGGLAIAIAAGALAPRARPPRDAPWSRAVVRGVAITALPATLRFTGSGIAVTGTIGERCCEGGRVRVLIDGREPVDATGIWQNKSSIGRPLSRSVLFAWRWPASGSHELRFQAGAPNAKEGGSFLHVRAAAVLP